MKKNGIEPMIECSHNFKISALFLFFMLLLTCQRNGFAQSKKEIIDISNLELNGAQYVEGYFPKNRSGISSYFSIGAGFGKYYPYDRNFLLMYYDLGLYFNREKTPYSKLKLGISIPITISTIYGRTSKGLLLQLGYLLNNSTILELRAGPVNYEVGGGLCTEGQIRIKYSSTKRGGIIMRLSHAYIPKYENRIFTITAGTSF